MSPRRASRYNVDKVRDVQVVRRALSSQSGVLSGLDLVRRGNENVSEKEYHICKMC